MTSEEEAEKFLNAAYRRVLEERHGSLTDGEFIYYYSAAEVLEVARVIHAAAPFIIERFMKGLQSRILEEKCPLDVDAEASKEYDDGWHVARDSLYLTVIGEKDAHEEDS